MNTKPKPTLEPSLAATVAGEDLACGDYVALLTRSTDAPSYLWDTCGATLAPEQMVRLHFIPDDAGQPLKVVAICLPFVYATSSDGTIATIDVRRDRLARLDRACAQKVRKRLRAKAAIQSP